VKRRKHETTEHFSNKRIIINRTLLERQRKGGTREKGKTESNRLRKVRGRSNQRANAPIHHVARATAPR